MGKRKYIYFAESEDKKGGSDVLDKIRDEIEQLRNFRAENYNLEQYCDCFDARIIFRDEVFEIIDKYKRELER